MAGGKAMMIRKAGNSELDEIVSFYDRVCEGNDPKFNHVWRKGHYPPYETLKGESFRTG